MEKIRSLVRPIVTVLGALTISGMVYQGKEVPEWYIVATIGWAAYWFADRTRGKKDITP